MKNFKVVVVSDSLPINTEDDILCHHGILNMKWGVRRYQNADGSLTDAGRRRYAAKKVTYASKAEQKKQRAIAKAEEKRNQAIAKAERRAKESVRRYNQATDEKLEAARIKVIEQNRMKAVRAANKKAKKEAALQAKKEKLITKGSVYSIYKNRKLLTDAEFNRALERAKKTEAVKTEMRNIRQQKFNNAVRTVNNVKTATNSAADIFDSYSTIMTGVNAVAGTKIPTYPNMQQMRNSKYYDWAAKKHLPVSPVPINQPRPQNQPQQNQKKKKK